MKNKNVTKTELLKYVFLYTILFCIAFIVIFFQFIIQRRSLVLNADQFHEAYPSFIYIGRYIREALRSVIQRRPGRMFDLSLGYGSDILTTLNWSGFGDLFSLTAALLPVEYSAYLFTASAVLKMYFAGISFSFAAFQKGYVKKAAIAAAALFYVFSGYTLNYGLTFTSFMTVPVYFPLIVTGVDSVMGSIIDKTGKLNEGSRRYTSFLLIISVALQALCGFYFIYIDILFGIFYCSVIIAAGKYGWKTYLEAAVRIGMHFITGILTAGILFIPTIAAFLDSPRSKEQENLISMLMEHYSWPDLQLRFQGLLMGPGYHIGLGLSCIPVAAIAVVLLKRNTNKAIRILVMCGVLAYGIPAVGIIMNGFSYNVDRWEYLLIFVIAISILEVYEKLTALTKAEISILTVLLVLWIANFFVRNGLNTYSVKQFIYPMIPVLAYIALLASRRIINGRPAVLEIGVSAILFAGTILVGFQNMVPDSMGGLHFYQMGRGFHTDQDILNSKFAEYSYLDQEGVQGIYRTDITDSSLDASAVVGRNGASNYYSITNPWLYEFYAANMISGGISGSTMNLSGLEGRKALETIMSVKSYADNASAEEIRLNPYAPALGILFHHYIRPDAPEIADPLDRNQAILYGVIINDMDALGAQDLSPVSSDDLHRRWDEIPCTYSFSNTSEDGKEYLFSDDSELVIHIEQEWQDDAEYYLYLENLIYHGNITLRDFKFGGSVSRTRASGSYAGQQDDFLIKIPEKLKGQDIAIKCPPGEFTLDSIKVRRLEPDIDRMMCLKEKKEITTAEYAPDRIVYSTDSDQKGILLLTVPYSKGFTCRIDGSKTDIYRADDGFMAVNIPEGEHIVEFSYRTPFLGVGALSSLIGIVLVIILFRRRSIEGLIRT